MSLGVFLAATSLITTFATGTAQAGNIAGASVAKKFIQVEDENGNVTTSTSLVTAGESRIVPISNKLFSSNPNSPQATSCNITVNGPFNGTSGNGRAPHTRWSFIRTVYLLTPAEMAALDNLFEMKVKLGSFVWDEMYTPAFEKDELLPPP